VSQAESTIGSEEDDSATTTEAAIEVGHSFTGSEFGSGSGGYAIDSPLAEHEFHDGLAPASERNSGGEIVGIATATDER